MPAVEETIIEGIQWLRLAIETLGACVIAVGVLVALATFARAAVARHAVSFTAMRLSFARYLVLALEFQVGADILSTAVAPTWDQIGKLGAIAVIRTALNYFLTREMREETARIEPAAVQLKPEYPAADPN